MLGKRPKIDPADPAGQPEPSDAPGRPTPARSPAWTALLGGRPQAGLFDAPAAGQHIQAKPLDEAAEPSAPPASAAALIVEDDAPGALAPGQMRKSDFLAQLQASVCRTADEALAGTIWSSAGCPWVDHWFSYYGDQDAAHVERAIRKYAPDAAGARDARALIPAICARVRRSIDVWADTGEVVGVPDEFAGQIPGGGVAVALGVGLSSVAGAIGQGIGSVAGTIGQGIGGLFSSIGSLFAKGGAGGARPAAEPRAVQQQLGGGHALDGGVQRRMEGAFGVSFGDVRVHSDDGAARLSSDLNARAFTVGPHIAFGGAEYQPGTLVGDALIAHELAHVVQQRAGAAGVAPLRPGDSTYDALEQDADHAAIGALTTLHGGPQGGLAQLARSALPQLRSGLRLQSCKGKSQPAAAPKEPALLTDFAAKFSAAADLVRKEPTAMKLVAEADAAGAKFGGYAEDGPGKQAWAYTIATTKTVYVPKARTDAYIAMSDFLFELNNAIRGTRLADLEIEATKGSTGKLTAKDYAYKKVEIEVEGMLRTGEVWFETKKKLGTDPKWDVYNGDFFLAEYRDFRDGKKTKVDIIKDVLSRPTGADASKTTEQMYMDQYNGLSGGK